MRKKGFRAAGLLLCLALTAGCGVEPVSTVVNIELIEPVGNEVGTEPVVRRNLYDAVVYEAAVYPYVEEYSYGSEQAFDHYAVFPGDMVKKGQAVVYANTANLDAQLEKVESRIQTLTENYTEYCASAEEKRKEYEYDLEIAQWALGNLEDPDYPNRDAELKKWKAEYNYAELQMQILNQEELEKKQLFDLDYEFYDAQRRELKAALAETVLYSEMDGQVVAIQQLTFNRRIPLGEPVMAVANMDNKYIKCEYLSPKVINEAYDIYAFINGERYEVSYVAQEGTEATTFELKDPENKAEIGSFAMLVFLKNAREQALTLSNDAIHNE